MDFQRASGLVLIVLGVVLFMIGLNASDSIADRWSRFFSGNFTETTTWYMVTGVLAAVGGLLLFAFRFRTRLA